MSDIIRVFVTNLGKYNEGQLVGEWLGLPALDKEISACLERIGVSSEPDETGVYYEEYFITDYESDLGLEIGQYSYLEGYNELAWALDGLDETELDVFKALTFNGCGNYEALGIIRDHEYEYIAADNPGDLAYNYFEECGDIEAWERAGVPIDYIDWNKLGDTFDDWIATDNGYVKTF